MVPPSITLPAITPGMMAIGRGDTAPVTGRDIIARVTIPGIMATGGAAIVEVIIITLTAAPHLTLMAVAEADMVVIAVAAIMVGADMAGRVAAIMAAGMGIIRHLKALGREFSPARASFLLVFRAFDHC